MIPTSISYIFALQVPSSSVEDQWRITVHCKYCLKCVMANIASKTLIVYMEPIKDANAGVHKLRSKRSL